MKMTTKELCIQGLLTALVTVCTMVFQIPVSATQGYIHLGDSMILLTSVFFGWKYGMAAGGIGSALADLLSGYAHWAPFTLIIKGGMGLLIGLIADFTGKQEKFFTEAEYGRGRDWHYMDGIRVFYRRRHTEKQFCRSGDVHSGESGAGGCGHGDFPCGRHCVL